MNALDIILVSLSMAADAMTVNATNGISEKNINIKKLLFAALVFGIMQFLMPVIGYFIGFNFRKQLELYIPWIAFSLLLLLGIKSIISFIRDLLKSKEEGVKEIKKVTIPTILVEGIATSIDALCIGFVYLNLPLSQAMLTFGIIGITTFVLSFITGLTGKLIGDKLEKYASLISGIIFIAVGLKILLEGVL